MKQLLTEVDTWIRRKILGNLLETVEEGANRCRMIRHCAIPEWKVHELVNCRKGPWRAALMLSSVLTNKNSPPWLYNHDELLQISL